MTRVNKRYKLTLGFNVLFSVKPLTCRLSAVFRNMGSIFWPTFTSPCHKNIQLNFVYVCLRVSIIYGVKFTHTKLILNYIG